MSLHRVFDSYRSQDSSDNDKIRCNASELLGLYALLRHFVETVVGDRPEVAAQRASFDAICEAVDLVLLAKRRVCEPAQVADTLQACLRRHMQLHIAAYGVDLIKPKHHWMMDVPQQFRRDKCVLDAFVIERMHLGVKAVADHVDNTARFERSVLSGVVNAAFKDDQGQHHAYHLRGKVVRWPDMPDVLAADHLTALGMQVGVGDVVFRGDDAGEVVVCLSQGGLLMVLVQTLRFDAVVSRHSNRWLQGGHQAVWLAAHIEQSVAWYDRLDGSRVVIRC